MDIIKQTFAAVWLSISVQVRNVILSLLLCFSLVGLLKEAAWTELVIGILIRLPYLILIWVPEWLRGNRVRIAAVVIIWIVTVSYAIFFNVANGAAEFIFYLIGYLVLSLPIYTSLLLTTVIISMDAFIFGICQMAPNQILIFSIAHAGTYILFWGSRVKRETNEAAKRHYEELREVHAQLKQTHEELQDTHRELEEATVRLLHYAVLEERSRISMDLHDSIGNGLTSAIVQLQALPFMMKKDAAEADKAMITILNVVKHSLQEVRTVAHRMGSDEVGLGLVALSSLVNQVREMAGFTIKFFTPEPTSLWTPETSELLYRTLQEALTNVIRHAQASEVEICISEIEGKLAMSVEDNGIYSEEHAVVPGFGLSSMKARCERAGGSLSVEAVKPQGMKLTLNIPLHDTKDRTRGEKL
ncbi:sensor histidine kinase [Paenibacillus nitricinens]|uniref:sensor histidine kinase n=1 Tax=Paenibacillus nitricinens TaxID=3367691 RepID=UPI003F84A810